MSFASIDELRDVESLNLYKELCHTMSAEEAFHKILAGTRDHARTPMQWSQSDYAGFSTHIPWIMMDEDYKKCNVESQLQNHDSILQFYKKVIALRKAHEVIYYGETIFTNKKVNNRFSYYRKNQEESLYIDINLSTKNIRLGKHPKGTCLISNYGDIPSCDLRPYEAIIWKIE